MIGAQSRPQPRQAALDPAASVWVAASAGTGKTRVLTERLLALLLDGTDPSHILCLTFTRAAAAEMANRVNDRLARWATMPQGALAEELVALTGLMPDDDTIDRAARLFARVLDTPGGAKIATIHAFCQSLLRRFPLEAGVPPEFGVIDERSAGEALEEAGATVIAAARAGDAPDLAGALAIVARHAPEERFAELVEALARDRAKLHAALADGDAALRARLDQAMNLPEGATTDGIVTTFCAVDTGDEAGLRAAAAAMVQGLKSDQPRGAVLARWCDAPSARPALLDDYLAVFLTKEGEIRQSQITKGAASKSAADLVSVLNAEAARVKRFTELRAAVALREATLALARLGDALLGAYEHHKRLHGQLDYDDLVLEALALLQRPGIAPWVLFKLDGGLDHILIDEAQDTNPEQWRIVASLAEEFFAGEGTRDREPNRTIFAVGDAKQSIYSFQRADPRAFVEMRAHFEQRVSEAQQDFRVVPLDISYRATEPLLRAVDAIFALPEAAQGVALDGGTIRHLASRKGHGGIVELWPPVPATVDPPCDPLAPEGVAPRAVEARTRLANAIAATVRQWLDRGEQLETRGRRLRPGDIMVLVRRRTAFVGDLLRALKQRGVPVAGADRLVLTEQLAVQDLIALGRFLLSPEDDLTLATVLKGPLFDIDEDDLFRLAYDRGEQSLWRRLRRLAVDDLVFRASFERLSQLLARADFVPPYELYADILGADGGRGHMLERLGLEAADPIEEFLALALAYEREHVPSLQGFLHWLVAGGVEVKRDFGERQRDELRIMTVHGAKGLETPVVILPDTMQLPDRGARLLWTEAGDLPLWCPRAAMAASSYTAERDKLRARQLQEYRRLLYVALTRAEDRLYICGWQTRLPAREALSWHALCEEGLRGIADRFAFDAAPLIGAQGWAGEGWRLVAPQLAAPKREPATAAERRAGPMPGWASLPPPVEPDPPKPLLPSRPSGVEPATLSPLAQAGRDRFKRGLLVHRLLQSLPELPAGERAAAARRFLALPLHALSRDEQDEIGRETLAVIEHPDFAELWGADAQAEVPVVGLIPGASPGTSHALSGQIDRLVVTAERVLIVDYKTLRPPPATDAEVPAMYLRQLATYRGALRRIYPDRPVDCAILWTEGPRLMPISPALLTEATPGGRP